MTRRRNAGYSDIACPQCGRRLPFDEQGRLPPACPVCDEPVVVPETAEEIAERQAGYAKAIGPQIPKEQLPAEVKSVAPACFRSPCDDPKITQGSRDTSTLTAQHEGVTERRPDGTRYLSPNVSHRAGSVSLKLLQGIQKLCWRLGWSAGVQIENYAREAVIEGRTVQCRDGWTIDIKKQPHKQSRTKFDDTHVWRSVKSVSKRRVRNAEVLDFEVAQDHTFCLPGVVVHNCQGFSLARRSGDGHCQAGTPRDGLHRPHGRLRHVAPA
jgi:uncharacterized Zn finger protein (UPF0148 family)